MMKTTALALISVFLIIVCIISCNLEVNTSDAQSSSNINESKQDGFFISEYNHSTIPNRIFNISEAWVETIWFNKIRQGKIVKEKSNGIQLNLKLNSFSDPEFTDDKYLLTWRMKDKYNHFVGKGNGVYIFSLENEIIPDTIHISILKINQDRTTTEVSRFLLYKKN